MKEKEKRKASQVPSLSINAGKKGKKESCGPSGGKKQKERIQGKGTSGTHRITRPRKKGNLTFTRKGERNRKRMEARGRRKREDHSIAIFATILFFLKGKEKGKETKHPPSTCRSLSGGETRSGGRPGGKKKGEGGEAGVLPLCRSGRRYERKKREERIRPLALTAPGSDERGVENQGLTKERGRARKEKKQERRRLTMAIVFFMKKKKGGRRKLCLGLELLILGPK